MFPGWTLVVAFGAAVLFVLLAGWLVLGCYSRARQRDADRAAAERVTDPGVAAAWAYSRHHPDAARAPMVLDTNPDERGAPLRPGISGTRAAQTAQHTDAAGQGGEPG